MYRNIEMKKQGVAAERSIACTLTLTLWFARPSWLILSTVQDWRLNHIRLFVSDENENHAESIRGKYLTMQNGHSIQICKITISMFDFDLYKSLQWWQKLEKQRLQGLVKNDALFLRQTEENWQYIWTIFCFFSQGRILCNYILYYIF